MINFAIPGMYENASLNLAFLDYKKHHPEKFYDDVNINAVFGNFQFCIWDGGRVFNNYKQASKEDIEYLTKTYNDLFDVSVRLVFTNNQLQPEHYLNRFGNLCLSMCENEKNEIVLVNDDFKNYIHQNYPKYSFISSTTKCLNKEQTLEELNREDFKMVCLDYNLNSNINFLQSLTKEQVEKTEFLVNAICPPGCPNRKLHYKLNSVSHVNYGKNFQINCGIEGGINSRSVVNYKNNLTYEDIKNIYAPMGFKYFKLEGRTLSPLDVLTNYVQYMVKPEYQFEVLAEVYEACQKQRNQY